MSWQYALLEVGKELKVVELYSFRGEFFYVDISKSTKASIKMIYEDINAQISDKVRFVVKKNKIEMIKG